METRNSNSKPKAPSPYVFVSVDSKGFRVTVSDLESTVTGSPTSVDSKGLALHQTSARANSSRGLGPEGIARYPRGIPRVSGTAGLLVCRRQLIYGAAVLRRFVPAERTERVGANDLRAYTVEFSRKRKV